MPRHRWRHRCPQQSSAPATGSASTLHVQDTQFRRMRSEPNEVIRIRYDSFDNLVAMGVIRHPRPGRAAPDPFPGSQQRQFVPDPPG